MTPLLHNLIDGGLYKDGKNKINIIPALLSEITFHVILKKVIIYISFQVLLESN